MTEKDVIELKDPEFDELSIPEYDGIDISEGIDISKTRASKECDICHDWYFNDMNHIFEMVVMI